MFDTGKNISYEYDSLNRLTKETNLAIGSEWRYTYDNGGNITRKEEYNPLSGGTEVKPGLRIRPFLLERPTYKLGAATEQSSFAYDDSGNRQSTKERLSNGKERGLQSITNRIIVT